MLFTTKLFFPFPIFKGNENSLSLGCLEVVKQAFDKMDTCKDGVLKSEDIAK